MLGVLLSGIVQWYEIMSSMEAGTVWYELMSGMEDGTR